MTEKKIFFIFQSNSQLQVGHLSDFNLLFLIRSYSLVIVRRCRTFSVMFQWLMFVGVIFLVMCKFFGHIHLVILNRSNEYSSNKVSPCQLFCVVRRDNCDEFVTSLFENSKEFFNFFSNWVKCFFWWSHVKLLSSVASFLETRAWQHCFYPRKI